MHPQKQKKYDRSEWRVIIILQMMWNKNKNSTGLIDGSQGFARCAQILLDTKIGGVMTIQKLWVKWTVGSWSTMGTRIILVQHGRKCLESLNPTHEFFTSTRYPYLPLFNIPYLFFKQKRMTMTASKIVHLKIFTFKYPNLQEYMRSLHSHNFNFFLIKSRPMHLQYKSI